MVISPVAYYHSVLKEKFGTPRQSGLIPGLKGTVKLCEGFGPEMLEGLDDFDYIWLIWGFNLNRDGARTPAKVRPPRLGGNAKTGVFATRSPYRPNPVGLSSVRLESIDHADGLLHVLGADLVDETPIFDIKPYLEYSDSHSGIRNGFTDTVEWRKLNIEWDGKALEAGLTQAQREELAALLSLDPRPAYQNDPDRGYGLSYDGWNIRFRVEGKTLIVESAARQRA